MVWQPCELLYTCYLHTHTRLTTLFPGQPGWAGTPKVKPIWILLKQESEWQWHQMGICKSAPRSRQITTPAPHHSVFLQAGCPSCRPTNSVKALKANNLEFNQVKTDVPICVQCVRLRHCHNIKSALSSTRSQLQARSENAFPEHACTHIHKHRQTT